MYYPSTSSPDTYSCKSIITDLGKPLLWCYETKFEAG